MTNLSDSLERRRQNSSENIKSGPGSTGSGSGGSASSSDKKKKLATKVKSTEYPE